MSRHSRRPALAVHPLEARDVPALTDPSQLVVDQSAFDSSHVLVKWRDGQPHVTFHQGRQALGNGLYRVNLPAAMSVDQAVAALRARPGVALAQPDYRVEIARTPDDPSFGSLWGMDNTGQSGGTPNADIGAPVAWNTSTGTGRTVVAVIDTGVDYNHPDLAANMWRNTREIPGNGIDDDHNGYKDDVYGYDFANNDSNPMDDNGHGTHVSGTIGAVGDNGIGVAGVDWHVKIMALKFLDSSGSGYLSNAVRALNYAVANGAKVVNASFGGGGYDAAMATAINNARAHGVIVVAAAGNDSSNNDTTPSYPANYPGDNVISVAATDRNDQLAYFSNYGPTTVDIAAPGQSIYSTLPGGRYGTYSGTSMATPHVTGAIALVWDAHPNWTYQQVIAAILNTADRIPSLTGKVATGRLDVGKAITYGDSTPTPTPNPNPTPTPTPSDTTPPAVTGVTFSGSGSAISRARVTFSEAINAATFTTADVTLTGPSGQAIGISGVTAVAGTNNQFDVTFASLSAAGTYTLAIGPAVNDLAGNAMARRATATTVVPSAVSSGQTFTSTDVGQTIWDFGEVASAITVNQDIAISDLNVTVNVSHTYDSDLRMWLVGPDGTAVPLVNRRGGSGDNFSNTTFDDEASQGIGQGAAPFAGSFRPESSLSAFDGKSAKGTWYLVVEDVAMFDTGRLNGWSMAVQGTAAAGSAAARQAVLPAPPPISKSGQIAWWGGA
ncbi:MAG: S8 family serine peptidase [Zavarzinella sp.]|nr:S8 family serine peptidase [Zavarzinella sp.]